MSARSTPDAPPEDSSPRRVHHIDPLQNFWYFTWASAELKRGKMQPVTLLGHNILLGRTSEGKVFAMRNLCPHRSTPLHHGQFNGKDVQCHYHGWKFGADGACTHIPALCGEQENFGAKLRNKTYPCRDEQGGIWVFMGNLPADALPPIPVVPNIGEVQPQIYCKVNYPLNGEHAAYTFFDPAHVAFVHSSPFIHRKSHSIKNKTKDYAPTGLGWCMKRHPAPKDNMLYRLFGKNVTTEITYLLPGTRIEHIQGEKYYAIGIATVAPIDDGETVIHQAFYWNFPYLGPFKRILRYLILHFLTEDRKYAFLQQEGMAENRPFMLMGDADAQIQWYQRLRQAWLQADSNPAAFVNPLQEQTLRFRS